MGVLSLFRRTKPLPKSGAEACEPLVIWKCSRCTFNNVEPLNVCEMCCAPRGVELPSADAEPPTSKAAGELPPASVPATISLVFPALHSYSWCTGSSRLQVCMLAKYSEGVDAEGLCGRSDPKILVEHVLAGCEPELIWTGLKQHAARDAATLCATALRERVPAQEFLPHFCRPGNATFRTNFSSITRTQTGVLRVPDGSPSGTLLAILARSPSEKSLADLSDIILSPQLSFTPAKPCESACSPAADLKRLGTGDAFETPVRASREDAISLRQRRLRDRVELYGLSLDVMDSDGNCLFRAAARQLYGAVCHHELVRHRVVAQLWQERDTYLPFFADLSEFEQYVTGMAATGAWGDEFALRALAESYGAEVHILTSAQTGFYMLYTPTSACRGPRLFLAYTFPVHYDGLVVASSTAAAADVAPAEKSPGAMFTRRSGAEAKGAVVDLSPGQINFDLCFPSP